MTKNENKILIIVVLSLFFLDFLLLVNPFHEYIGINRNDSQQLSKKLINPKYVSFWNVNSFSLTGDNLKTENTGITLQKDKLKVLNWPFSKSLYEPKPIFELSYNKTNPKIAVSFDLDNNEMTYYYQKNSASEFKYVSIDNKEEKEFIENTSHMSLKEIQNDVERNRVDFLKTLNFVKKRRLEELQADLKFDSIFLLISNVIIIALVTLFLYIKV